MPNNAATAGSGYPQLRLSALLSSGTRSVIDAVFDPVSTGDLDHARYLARSLRPGMLLLADRNYAAAALIATLAATGAHLLIRCKPDANCRSCAVTATARSSPSSASGGSGSSTRRSGSPPLRAPTPAATGC
nr:transposase [Actinoplanes lichenis]